MASSLSFNGSVIYIPGGLSRIVADQLNGVTAGAEDTVALIGEADGGAPGTIVKISNPASAKAAFVSGKLVDAANNVFQPSNDPLISGGPSTVLLYKTNASTQSTVSVPAPAATRLVNSTATGGSTSTLLDSTLTATTVDSQFNGCWVILRPGTSTQNISKVTAYTASSGTFTVSPAFASGAISTNPYLILTNNLAFLGTVAAGGTTTDIPFTTPGFAANEHAGRWARITSAIGTVQLRKIASNTTTDLILTQALPAAPVALTTYVEILPNALTLTSRNYGLSTNGISVDLETLSTGARRITLAQGGVSEVSPSIGGFPFLQLLFKGAPVSVTDTAAASSTASVINLTTGGLTPSAQIGKQVLIDGQYTVITANTASAITVSPALSAAPTVGDSVQIFGITRAIAYVTGASGVATGLTTVTGVVGADLSIAFTAGQTVRQLADLINQNGNYVAVVPGGINGDTSLVKDFGFGPATQINILTSASLTTAGFKQDAAQLVLYLSQVSQLATAVRTTAGTFDGAGAPDDIADPIFLTGAVRGVSTNSSFQAGFDAILGVRANLVVPLIAQDLVNEGNGSTATAASVIAQAEGHVIAARGQIGSERGAVVGFTGTKAQIIAQANSINDPDVQLVAQNITLLNTAGTLTVFGPEFFATVVAGMRVGVNEVGEPLTNKLVKASAMTQDASWSPTNLTDANDMIRAGVLFTRTNDQNVIKICRDLTTWVSDNNLSYSEGSIRDEVRFVVYNLRKTIVDRYVGRKSAPATLRNIKNTAVSYLELVRSQQIIVDTTDAATGAPVKAYHNLTLTASGDTVAISVCLCFAPGINFISETVILVPYLQSI